MEPKTKQSLLVTVVGVTLFVALLRLSDVLAFAAKLIDLVLPILAGGILALFIMWALKKPLGEEKLWVLSAFGAMGHNLGQMAAALFITRTTALLYYLPVLMVSAIGTGIFTGLCAQLVSRRAQRAGFLSK